MPAQPPDLPTANRPTRLCPTCYAQFHGGETFCPEDASRLVRPSQCDAPVEEAVDPTDPLIGRTLAGRYKILRKIGEGGMGFVYEAEHTIIEKRVALKVLRDDFSSRPDVVERFRQEAKSASRIGHQHIVDISDFGETPSGQSFFVMEMLDGEDLADLLARSGSLPARRAIGISIQCARALGAAHDKGIVHRDMKPENIFLVRRQESTDFVKIVDFGIAKMSDVETAGAPGRKLTKTGMIFGTPEYMSPEQAAGKPLDHRVDVYALGVILYEMLSGKVPFEGDTFMGILTQHMFEAPKPIREVNPAAQINTEIEQVIGKAMAKDPETRYASMQDLAGALESLHDVPAGGVASSTVIGYGHGVAPSGGAAVRRLETVEGLSTGASSQSAFVKRRIGWGVAAAGAVAAAVAGWFWLQSGDPAEVAEPSSLAAAPPANVQQLASAPGEAEGSGPARALDVPPSEGSEDQGQEPSGETSPGMAEIVVQTQPSGATISAEGRGVVCEASPCTISASKGKLLALQATKGRGRAETEIRVEEGATVEMQLRAPRRSRRRRSTQDHEPSARRRATDLKIPPEFAQ